MKREFVMPTIDIIEFETADIITTSLLYDSEEETGSGIKIKW